MFLFFLFGEFDCVVDVVVFHVFHPDGSWSNVTMSYVGDDVYFCNTSFLVHGLVSYVVSAVNLSGNVGESGVFEFLMLPNWDINMDGVVDIWDVSLLSAQWMATGVSGWIREDINNDVVVDVWDVSILSTYWMESWI